ncbi:ABC transporter ATP-binding protein [Candidatus Hydrogenedentota bacterium]
MSAESTIERGGDARRSGQWRVFVKTLRYAKPYWHVILLKILLGFIHTSLFLVNPLFLKWMIDDAIPNHDWHIFKTLIFVILGWIALFLTQYMLAYVMECFFSLRIMINLRIGFFKHMELLSMAFFHERPVGENMFRCWDDIEETHKMLCEQVPTIIQETYAFIGATIVTIILDWRVAIAVLGYAVIYAPLAHFVTNVLRRYEKAWRVGGQQLKAALQEGLHGYATIKAFGKRPTEIRRYMRATSRWYRQWLKFWLWRDIVLWQFVSAEGADGAQSDITGMEIVANPLLPWVRNLGLSLFVFQRIIFCRITPGYGAALIELVNRPELANPIRVMIDRFQRARLQLVSAERMFETLDRMPSVAERPEAIELSPIKESIEFENVHFAYGDREILKDISFTMRPNHSVAFVGESGIGKSTIVNLILRLYDPQAGRILADGTDIKDVQQVFMRQQFGLVLQDTFLFNGSMKDNIRLSKPGASDDEVLAVAKTVGVHDFITSLPAGYETDVSEGMGLSVGQKQQIAIARAIISDPRVLILDEATSSLDAQTEQEFMTIVNRLMKDRIVLIISHRISTAMNADEIFAMKDGRIVERGPHSELVSCGGVYAEMYKRQFSTELGEGNGL